MAKRRDGLDFDPIDVVEMLYQARLGLDRLTRLKRHPDARLAEDGFKAIAGRLTERLRAVRLDPGETTLDADNLKLRLMDERRAEDL